jgi:hypothetical protein
VVFAREVQARTRADPRIVEVAGRVEAMAGQDDDGQRARRELRELTERVRSEKLGEVAQEFDEVHSIRRALDVGSVDRIIPAATLRPYLVGALERGLARTGQGSGAPPAGGGSAGAG